MTYEELHAALNISRKIERLKGQLQDLHISGGIGGTKTNTPVQGGNDNYGIGQVAVELTDEIAELEKELEIEQTIIQRYIEKLSLEDIERKLMMLRYVDCKSWKIVQVRLCYSKSRIFQIHDSAIKKIRLH